MRKAKDFVKQIYWYHEADPRSLSLLRIKFQFHHLNNEEADISTHFVQYKNRHILEVYSFSDDV